MIKTSNEYPIPEREETRGRKHKYPWKTMNVGESFRVLPKELASVRKLAKANSVDGKLFDVRELETKHHCWRLK